MSIPCKISPMGAGEVLPVGYKRVKYLQSTVRSILTRTLYPTTKAAHTWLPKQQHPLIMMFALRKTSSWI